MDSVKGGAFTTWILWRELPSQKGFVKGVAFRKWILVKGTAVTKGIL